MGDLKFVAGNTRTISHHAYHRPHARIHFNIFCVYATYLNLCAAASSPWQRLITCSRAMCSVKASLLTESLRVKNLQDCSRETSVAASKFRKIATRVASGSWSKDCVDVSVKDCILVRLSAISDTQKLHCKYVFLF